MCEKNPQTDYISSKYVEIKDQKEKKRIDLYEKASKILENGKNNIKINAGIKYPKVHLY